MTSKLVLLSAGGTGGHLFPAQSLAQELSRRQWTVHLATDSRAKPFLSEFPAEKVHIIESATFSGKSLPGLARTLKRLVSGYFASRKLIGQFKPEIVVGFGGYPTVPPLLAATHKGVATILHEQNAVMGRANRFLSGKVSAIATGFELKADTDHQDLDIMMTGNPLRHRAHEAARIPYPDRDVGGAFNLLVFGGSQGARFFSEFLPSALAQLDEERRGRLRVTLQSRPEDEEQARTALAALGISAEVAVFFNDLPRHIADAHLVMCRSGASSVAELALIGRPSVLVPLPGAIDDDQGANAAHLERAGGATLVRQDDLTAEKFAEILVHAIDNPDELALQAERAKSAGISNAAQRLADLVEQHAR